MMKKLLFTMMLPALLLLSEPLLAQDELPVTPAPVIMYEVNEDLVTIFAYGEGEVHLLIDGVEVGNPYIYPRSSEEVMITAMAWAQADGMEMSNYTVQYIVIPPLEVIEQTPPPYIEYIIGEEFVTILAVGEGEVHLMIDGMEVDNPCLYQRSTEDQIAIVMAWAQVEGMTQSDYTVQEIFIPALEIIEQTPQPYINIMNNGQGTVFVTIDNDYSDAFIYYSIAGEDHEFGEWYEYTGEIAFDQVGIYYIRAYAVLPGMAESSVTEASFYVNGTFYTIQPMAYANQIDEQQGLKLYFRGDPTYYYYLVPYSAPSNYTWPQYVTYRINGGTWKCCRVEEPVYLPDYGDYSIEFYGEASGYLDSEHVFAQVHYDADNYYSKCDQHIVYNGVVCYIDYQGTAGVSWQGHPLTTPYFYLDYEGDIVIPEVLSIEGRDYPVTTIEDEAFSWHSSITSLTIPKSVTDIHYPILPYENTCVAVTVEAGNPVYDTRDNCNAIIETASNTLVEGCPSSFIPASVTAIGDRAFQGVPLSSIDIPASVTTIGNSAFDLCRDLLRVTCHAIIPPAVGNDSFYYYAGYYDEPVTLFVPAEALEDYQAHETWGQFPRIVPFIGAGPGDVNGDGAVNITDVTGLIDLLLSGEELPAYIDVNGDGVVNITDVTGLIDLLLNGGN